MFVLCTTADFWILKRVALEYNKEKFQRKSLHTVDRYIARYRSSKIKALIAETTVL